MVDNSVNIYVEQHVVMKFLVNEGIKPAEIYRRLQAQYGDETLSHSKTFEWCKRFKDGRISITDDPGCGGSTAHGSHSWEHSACGAADPGQLSHNLSWNCKGV